MFITQSMRLCRLKFRPENSSYVSDYAQPTHGGESIEAIQQQLRLALLRQSKNAHIPILRLPPEILGIILLYACPRPSRKFDAHSSDGWLTDNWSLTLKDLVRFTQVCSCWHSVALSVPELWACITSSDSLEQMPLLLERSREAPLSVYLRPRHSKSFTEETEQEVHEAYVLEQLKELEVLRQHAGRIRKLVLRHGPLSPSGWWDDRSLKELLAILCSPAPTLEELDIEGLREIPGQLLGNHAPRLRTLRVRSVRVDLQGWPLLQNLHVLELQVAVGINTLSFSQIFRILRGIRCLRTLSLEFQTHADISSPEPLSQPAEISTLHTLQLTGLCRSLALFLENIALPALLRVSISASAMEGDDSDISRLLEAGVVSTYLCRWSGILGPLNITHDFKDGHPDITLLRASASPQARERPNIEIKIWTKNSDTSMRHALEASTAALSLLQNSSPGV
jgi:hypothetical protein